MNKKKIVVMMQRLTVLLVAVFLGLVGWRFGILSEQNLKNQTNSAVNTFQQNIPNVSIPELNLSGQGPASASSATICRANLEAIHRAKQRALKQSHFATGTPSWSEVSAHLHGNMSCPGGGSYTLNGYETAPTCSVGANGTVDKSDDHRIRG